MYLYIARPILSQQSLAIPRAPGDKVRVKAASLVMGVFICFLGKLISFTFIYPGPFSHLGGVNLPSFKFSHLAMHVCITSFSFPFKPISILLS